MATSSELTIDVARDWFQDKDAQACLFDEIARDHGFQLSEVERAYFYFDAPSPFTPDYRAAIRDALIAHVRADRTKYDVREKAHQQARRAELKARRARPALPHCCCLGARRRRLKRGAKKHLSIRFEHTC